MQITLLQNATLKDVECIYKEVTELVEKYEDLDSINYESVKKWLYSKIQKELKNYYCIYNENKKVGYILLKEVDDEIEIDDFYLFEKERGKGIGTIVLEKMLKKDENYFLFVFKENTKAINLYKRFGFEVDHEVGKTRLFMRCKKAF